MTREGPVEGARALHRRHQAGVARSGLAHQGLQAQVDLPVGELGQFGLQRPQPGVQPGARQLGLQAPMRFGQAAGQEVQVDGGLEAPAPADIDQLDPPPLAADAQALDASGHVGALRQPAGQIVQTQRLGGGEQQRLDAALEKHGFEEGLTHGATACGRGLRLRR